MSQKPQVDAGNLADSPAEPPSVIRFYTILFGLFLGLCIWKFGNPVILDNVIVEPKTSAELLNELWPTHWASWFLVPVIALGAVLVLKGKILWGTSRWLWILPLAWLGWQFVSATQSVRPDLTAATLWQYGGCVACYFLGALLFARDRLWRWLLIGVLIAFAFCLVRAVQQRVFEFPSSYQGLVQGEREGWTNMPPATLAELRTENIIITTNGMEVANPAILAKFQKGRVYGTLVYPNALAELILLLWPVSLVLAFKSTRNFRPLVRWAALILTVFLGATAFFWTGSKLGWLIGLGLAGALLLQLNWSRKLKIATVATVLILGLGVFAVRFHHYFATGAHSVVARFDYWRAAVQNTAMHPLLGSGPGTFQHPYALLKAPESEMARLTHNDYLEQFSDSGVPGGLLYIGWIVAAVVLLVRKLGDKEQSGGNNHIQQALFIGLLGWLIQGFGEFGLFVPALGWTAFTLLGCLVGRK